MGSIRYETAYASALLVEELRVTGMLGRMLHNGVDIVLFETPRGERVSAHLIDSGLPLYEIRKTLTANAEAEIYTLYLLWADMMLPAHGQRYQVDDWMEALYTLYGGSIYAYEIIEGEPFLFPVHFRGAGLVREAEFGTAAQFRNLTCRRVQTYLAGLHGKWWVADLGGAGGFEHDAALLTAVQAELAEHYAALGLPPDADRSAIKKAYRLLARRYHPDLNRDDAAHDQMQRINAAYARLIEALGDD
jgi:hypothetical protein